jgi:hypothetical protein
MPVFEHVLFQGQNPTFPGIVSQLVGAGQTTALKVRLLPMPPDHYASE